MLQIVPVRAFSDNYIWLIINPANNTAACVDPGDAQPVIHYCEQNSITLCAILITHHHPDHTGGITKLVEQYNTVVYGPARESIAHCQHPLKQDDQIIIDELDHLSLRVLDIPGHTRGHIAYVGNGWLFCGDTLFGAGCGRIFEGTPQQMFDSLNTLKALDPATQVYCGHEYTLANLKFAKSVEPHNSAIQERITQEEKKRAQNQPTLPSTIDSELRTNPFLRADSIQIIEAAQRYRGQPLEHSVDVFATVRQMKDNF